MARRMQAERREVTLPALQQMKRDGRKIVGVVAWDSPIAQIVDRAGVDIVSVGDTVGINLWGHAKSARGDDGRDGHRLQGRASRRQARAGELRLPVRSVAARHAAAVGAAIRLVKEGGADLVKLDGARRFPEAVRAIVRAGIPVFAQIGITPQTALQYGVDYAAMLKGGVQVPAEMAARLVDEAKRLEDAGAALIDFTNSGPVVGPEVVRAVSIPVIGGLGGGPGSTAACAWRMRRSATRASWLDAEDRDLRERRADHARRDHRVCRRRARGAPDQGRRFPSSRSR